MKNGQVKVWWLTEKNSGRHQINKNFDSLLDALWYVHCMSVIQVNDESIAFNASSIMYYNEEFLKEEYDCKDGFTDMYLSDGDSAKAILDYVYDIIPSDQEWWLTTKEQIKDYVIRENIEAESDCIKMY